ncbi:MAG: tyrosine-type recombinase/integrase [Labilithrix sp.]
MSVRKEKRRNPKTGEVHEKYTVDVAVMMPDGSTKRVRKDAPVQTKRDAERFEQDLRRALLDGTYGKEEEREPTPTLAEFKDRFILEYCKANKHKPSGIEGKESAFRNYLLPVFGNRRLDTFTAADEDRLKKALIEYSPATYNNVASVMNSVFKAALRWNVVRVIPHRFMLMKRQKPRPKFYDFDQYERLVEAAAKIDPRIHLLVLLGGDAGLRRGEIISLEWTDADLFRGQLTVERSEWKANVTDTKGMKYRVVPMTKRLRAALTAHRHLKGDRVLYTDAGETVTAKVLQKWMAKAQRRANVKATGGLHILRHTFCSHLAMKGAPALSIQKLAGHEDLQTTLGYMHLAVGETDRAIRLLEEPHGHVNTASIQQAPETN